MIEQEGLTSKYSEYAIDHAVYVKNRIFCRSIDCTPYEKLNGTKMSMKYVCVFGCTVFCTSPRLRQMSMLDQNLQLFWAAMTMRFAL